MTSWPIEISGREFHPIPDSWIDHGDDHDSGSPRLYAVSVAHPGRGRLFVRYAHPRDHGVYTATMEGTEHDGGIVPSLLVDGSWPRSLVPPREIEAHDVVRELEREHLADLWADRDHFRSADTARVDDPEPTRRETA